MIVHDKKTEPHWAPGAAEYLDELIDEDFQANEWGGGGSSPWLARRVGYLHVVESDPGWARQIRLWCIKFTNVAVHERSRNSSDYVHCLDETFALESPRLFLIDGYQRIQCLDHVLTVVRGGDIVVLDDALDYAEGHDQLKLWTVAKFKMKHPYAGTPIGRGPRGLGNTNRTHHAMTKETWVCRV